MPAVKLGFLIRCRFNGSNLMGSERRPAARAFGQASHGMDWRRRVNIMGTWGLFTSPQQMPWLAGLPLPSTLRHISRCGQPAAFIGLFPEWPSFPPPPPPPFYAFCKVVTLLCSRTFCQRGLFFRLCFIHPLTFDCLHVGMDVMRGRMSACVTFK